MKHFLRDLVPFVHFFFFKSYCFNFINGTKSRKASHMISYNPIKMVQKC